MTKTKKEVSREIGLEIGSICGNYFLKLDHLHYGYWEDDLKAEIANVPIAQEEYVNFLISHIPRDAKTILDVGCGMGRIAEKLISMGYKVDCVSPSHFLAGKVRELLGKSSNIYECTYEQLELQAEYLYDVILFSESFQYIDIEKALSKTVRFINPAGCMLICDFFQKDTSCKSTMSGGHKLKKFNSIISRYPLKLIKDVDITDKTAPSLDVLNDAFQKAIRPTVLLTQKLLENRYPFVSKLLKWVCRKKISKINKKYFNAEKTADSFKKFKSYRLMLYKKNLNEFCQFA